MYDSWDENDVDEGILDYDGEELTSDNSFMC